MRYLTNDLAKLLGVTTNTIRRYENSGFLKPKRDPSNYRYYEDFDISKAAVIRLFGKCGFSHDEIRQMLGNDSNEIFKILDNKLHDLDKQIEKLKHLRHWLKDNMQLMITVKGIKNNFVIMNCPALKYIIYSVGEKILDDKNRLNIINHFMYGAPEVQLMQIFKKEDLKDGNFIPYKGWAVKEIDVEKFNMRNFINSNNEFIETYEIQKCIYGVIEFSHNDINNNNKMNQIRTKYLQNATAVAKDKGYTVDGDMVEFIVNALGNTISVLSCLPIKAKTQI